MTRDDIIRMAREAGIVAAHPSVGVREADMIALERFATLVAAEERKAIAIEMQQLQDAATTAEKWRGIATAKFGDGRSVSEIEREAMEAERKACAKVCRDWGMEKVLNWQHDPEMRNDAMARAHDAECCAALILKRGDHVITGSVNK